LLKEKGDPLSGNAMSLEFVFYFGAPSGQVMASTVSPVPLEPRSSFGAKLIAVPCSTKVAPEHNRKNKGITKINDAIDSRKIQQPAWCIHFSTND